MTDTDLSDMSSTSDVHYSDIEFDTPNTTDMKLSDISDYPYHESLLKDVSFERRKHRVWGTLEEDSLSSASENEFDTVPLCSYVTNYGNTCQYDSKCAVILCNANARNQFNRLFFINFPRDNRNLCEIWWRLCGHHGTFNPLSKICSIHFKAEDFTSNMVRRNGKLYKQTVLKNKYIVPTLYLQSHEYTRFTWKQNKRVNGVCKLPKKLTSVYVCVIQGCKKTSLKNGKNTLFFKFPLENKFLLRKWLNIIGLPFWKPLKTNRICSDHFESYYIKKIDNIYQLNKFAVPSIKPKYLFSFNQENNNSRQFKTSVNDHINPCDFGRLEFNIIDRNTLMVKEKKRKSNDEKTILLNSLENKIDQQLKKYDKILETTTFSNSIVINNSDKEEQLLNSSIKCNKSNVEEMLSPKCNTSSVEEMLPKCNTSNVEEMLPKCNTSNVEEMLPKCNTSNVGEMLPKCNTSNVGEMLPKCNTSNVEEILNDVNDIKEFQSKEKITLSLTKQYLESFEKEIAKEGENINGNINNNDIDLEYVYLDILNDVNMNASVMEVQPTCGINNSLKDEHNTTELEFETNKNGLKNMSVESIKTNILYEDKEVMNKISNNSDIDLDYVYLGMLNDENMMGVQPLYDTNISVKDGCNTTEIRFETNNINSKNINKESTNLKIVEEIPKSIIYDQDLTECYGEMLPPYCDPNCELKCYYSIPGPQRRQIFNQFHMLQNVTEQNCKITQLVQLVMVENLESNFEKCLTFHLIMDKESVKVCRMFFMNTLGISDHRLDAVLKPVSYSWYSNSDIALKANQPKQTKVISEQIIITDFMKESLKLLDKDYNLYEPESDTEVSLDNVPSEEQEKVLKYIKSIPRILCMPKIPGDFRKLMFETSICVSYMYKTYSENYIIKNKIPPPYTKRQFKKIYNQYMKTHLKMI